MDLARNARAVIGAALDLLNRGAATLDVTVKTGALDWKEAALYLTAARMANRESGGRLDLLSVDGATLRILGGAAHKLPFELPDEVEFCSLATLSGR